mmetsp:Transcript_4566/g.11599  ORF Transcript_4566/g.11599 Transcript_4566/m.11599 type:complete len:92 (-) Transcript_4566:2642-2917(-)
MTNGDKATDQSVQIAGEPTEKISLNTPAPAVKEEENMVCLDLGSDMPSDMKDVVASYALQKQLNRCHAEGFIDAVREHVSGLARSNGVRKG